MFNDDDEESAEKARELIAQARVIAGQLLATDKAAAARLLSHSLTREEQKEILREGLTEWLDAKVARFGYFSLIAIASMFIAVVAYLALSQHGWQPPQK